MSEMQYGLDCATTVLSIVLWIYMLWHLRFKMKRSNKILRVIGVLLCAVGKEVLILLHIPPVNFVSQVVMLILIALILFSCKAGHLVLYTLLFCSIELASDAFGVTLTAIGNNLTIAETLNTDSLTFQHHLANWILWVMFIRMFCVLISKKGSDMHIQLYEIVFYFILSALECFLFAYVSSMISDQSNGASIIVMMFGFLFIDFSFIIFFHRMSTLREKESQFILVEQREKMEIQAYQDLESKFRQSQKIVHDMNRHLRVLRDSIQQTQDKQSERYITDLEEIASQLVPPIRNQNRILEIILNTIFERCREKNIKLEMDIEDFSLDFLSDIDIIAIFSNLLDNAIDACDAIDKGKEIKVSLNKCLNLMILEVTNFVQPNHIVSLNRSAKTGHMGLGITIINQAVEKYNGVFSWKQHNNEYIATVTIPIE